MTAFQSRSHAMRCTDASIVTDGIQRNELGRIADSKGLQAARSFNATPGTGNSDHGLSFRDASLSMCRDQMRLDPGQWVAREWAWAMMARWRSSTIDGQVRWLPA